MKKFTETKNRSIDNPELHKSSHPSRKSESSEVTSSNQSKKSKTFLGKLLSRRESSADFIEKTMETIKKPSKVKLHESNRGPWSTLDHHSVSYRPPSLASLLPGDPSRHLSKSTKNSGITQPSVEKIDETEKETNTEAVDDKDPEKPPNSSYITLDTDLEHMTGIVDGKKSNSATGPLSLPSAGVSNAVAPFNNTPSTYISHGTPDILQSSKPSIGTIDPTAAWKAPESWNIVPESTDVLQWPSDYDNMIPKRAGKPQKSCVRVFREDGTFGTVSCDVDITVTELIQLLGRKFYLPSVAGYQLTVRTGGLKRILMPKERPLVYQQLLLTFMGYTEDDRLGDLGRDDLSYMCRFELSRLEMRTFTLSEKEKISQNFVNADMRRMDLQTIPVIYYSHCLEIEHLDVSENPSITIPSDFIQACANLKSISYVGNKALQFPLNILHTQMLRNLDLSSNLISHLDNIDFSKLASLVSLDLHGNRLSNINDSITELKCLENFNISSNILTEISISVCQLTSLRRLDVSFNKISQIPEEIGLLSNLEDFAISNNYLNMTLPTTFVRLLKLEELDIRYNKLTNIDLLSKLPKLTTLLCSKNTINTIQAQFTELRLFHFDRNPLTKIDFLEGHFSLRDLNLSKAKLSALSKSFLEKIPLVEKLVLDKNHLSSLPPCIGILKNLVHLSIVANNLDSVPPEISNLQDLRFLDLHNNNIRTLPEEIWALPYLESLNVSSNLIEVFPKHDTNSSISSSESDRFRAFGDIVKNYEISDATNNRRPSALSLTSSLAPNDRRLSAIPATSTKPSITGNNKDSPSLLRPRRNLSQSLLFLSISDNRLTDECFEEISKLTKLKVLNISYNELVDIPYGALRRLSNLNELYVSGNHLTSLPADDLESIKTLRVLYVNGNKLHTLPAELGKIEDFLALDVGSNNLKYNISNWPYDWNWNWNLKLRYLNFSGNRRLEIKAAPNQANHFGRDYNSRDLSDFTVLNDMRILGLMDVTLITPSVPDQTENCRVRTYGSMINAMPFGMADSLGNNSNLSIIDMVLERFRGKDNEVVVGLFDGRSQDLAGNKVSKLIQENFGNIFTQELKKLKDEEGIKEALRRAFLNTNKEIGNTTLMPTEEIAHSSIAHRSSTAMNMEYKDGMTGSCATIVYMKQNKLYIANAGDSMAIISGASGEYRILTTRHDPTSETELARIRAGAGIVSSTGKLDGKLDVSRAIGFYNLIPHIHARPSVSEYDLSDNDEILILGSKHLWEHVSYQIALDVVRTSNDDLMKAAAKLRDFAISYGASEKIMVMVIGVGISKSKSKNRMGRTVGPMTSIGEEELFPVFKKKLDRNLLPEDSRLARLGGEVDPPVNELAMVFTDIKNSTLLWETSPVAMRAAIKVHNSIMRRQLRIIGGYEVKTEGDAFMVSFPTPTSALLWCFSVQSLLLVADWPTEILDTSEGREVLDDKDEVIFRGLSVRMGIHWGSPVCERDPITRRMDYFGPMVNRAARVSAVADGGQITLSFDFVSEMTRLTDILQEYKGGKYTTLAEAFGGDESLGLAIEHDVKMLNNLGWEKKILGEEKLKGLENPEFISLAYQKTLLGRYPIHCERLLQKRSPNQAGLNTATTVSQSEMDLMVQLREVSIRLENICTRLNDEACSPKQVDVSSRISNIVGLSSLYAPCSEADYAIFLGHLVTRIENCLSTLFLRTTVFNLTKTPSVNVSTCDLITMLSDILNIPTGITLRRNTSGPSEIENLPEASKSYTELEKEGESLENEPLHVTKDNHEFYSAPPSPKLDSPEQLKQE